ncbi:MAG: carbohydrate ABC transporter permease [Clostridiaceae bacterium]
MKPVYGKELLKVKVQDNASRKIFNVFNILFMLFISVITLYPMLYVIFASFSRPSDFMMHQGLLIKPLGFTTEIYRMVFRNPMILRGYLNTIFIVVVGVAINIFFTSIGAYFLSRKNVMLKKIVMFLIVFSMYFSGGLIPFYFTVKELGLDNSLWALIIPGAIGTSNMIVMRTAFMAIPDSLSESAEIDGASHFSILFRVVIPLSLPTMAVMVLYYGVGHWNSWFNALIFLRKREMFPLQLILREILITNTTMDMSIGVDAGDQELVGDLIKYAVIVIATVPILCLYPFLQKYFVKGIMIGALKG